MSEIAVAALTAVAVGGLSWLVRDSFRKGQPVWPSFGTSRADNPLGFWFSVGIAGGAAAIGAIVAAVAVLREI